MGIVLAFPARPEKSGGGVKAHPADVVIFPGVRVERREFTPAEIRRLQHLPRVRANGRRARRHPLAEKTED